MAGRVISIQLKCTLLSIALIFLTLYAQETATLGAEEGKEVTLIGLNKCKACGEVKSFEPGDKCSPFGHTCTFSVEKAMDMEGKEIEELKKKELGYKLNQQSLPIFRVEENLGARLEIKGKWLKEKGEIEVSSFRRLEK